MDVVEIGVVVESGSEYKRDKEEFLVRKRPLPVVLYIAGYGRSGSTLLDMLLSRNLNAFGAGEISYLFESALGSEHCTCGEPVQECCVWKNVLSACNETWTNDEAAGITRSMERTSRIWRYLFREGSLVGRSYGALWGCALSEIMRRTGVGYIVDSSKTNHLTASRFVALRKHGGFSVRVVHLVRDPRAVMWSYCRGSNRKIEKGEHAHLVGAPWRALSGWILANCTVEVFARIAGIPLVRVRYEDLVRDPSNEIRRILGNEVVESGEQGVEPNGGHGIRGNRVRRAGVRTIALDSEWRERLPRRHRLAALLAWPLTLRYDYPVV